MKKQARNFLLLTTLTAISIYGINKTISVTSNMKNLLNVSTNMFIKLSFMVNFLIGDMVIFSIQNKAKVLHYC